MLFLRLFHDEWSHRRRDEIFVQGVYSNKMNCPTCGQAVSVHEGEEGTGCYIPEAYFLGLAEGLKQGIGEAAKELEKKIRKRLSPHLTAEQTDICFTEERHFREDANSIRTLLVNCSHPDCSHHVEGGKTPISSCVNDFFDASKEPEMPIMECPKCGKEHEDFDGFGVKYCAACGYCEHPARFGGECQLCGNKETA